MTSVIERDAEFVADSITPVPESGVTITRCVSYSKQNMTALYIDFTLSTSKSAPSNAFIEGFKKPLGTYNYFVTSTGINVSTGLADINLGITGDGGLKVLGPSTVPAGRYRASFIYITEPT